MNDQERLLLLHKRWTDSISPEELARLEEWLASDEAFRKEAKSLESLWEKAALTHSSFQPDTDRAWKRFRARMNARPRIFRLKRGWRIAAAIAVLIAVAGWFWVQSSSGQHISTADAIIENFVLPDGSVIWLNKYSRLEYPVEFDEQIRIVELKGEAYFEVRSDTEYPFLVKTPYGEVEVTGTEFNVRAYAGKEDFEEVFLKSGSVTYRENKEGKEVVLEPDSKVLHFHASSRLDHQPAPDALPLYWQEGKLKFKDERIEKVLSLMEAYYNVKFDAREVSFMFDCTISPDLSGLSLDEACQVITSTSRIEFNQVGRRMYELSGGYPCD